MHILHKFYFLLIVTAITVHETQSDAGLITNIINHIENLQDHISQGSTKPLAAPPIDATDKLGGGDTYLFRPNPVKFLPIK
jgi:hypothetical protein